MKFSALVILFNPTIDELNKTYENTLKFIDVEWIVVDNSPCLNDFFDDKPSVKYVFNANEGGIAGAINIGIDNVSNNSDFVFTFDQDSELPDNFFDSMEELIIEKNAKLVCANFIDINSNTYAKFVHVNKFSYSVVENTDYTNFAISSGLGINVNTWKKIGGVTSSYIIDHVDTEICLKAMDIDEKIYINYNVCLRHAIGKRSVQKFLGVTLKPNNHNHLRKYYIIRNGTHLAIKYLFSYPGYFGLNILRLVHEFLCVILYEDSKFKKIKYMALGFFHAIIGKLGAAK